MPAFYKRSTEREYNKKNSINTTSLLLAVVLALALVVWIEKGGVK